MQINNVNNASKNVVFNAKLQMEGAVKDLPKESLKILLKKSGMILILLL